MRVEMRTGTHTEMHADVRMGMGMRMWAGFRYALSLLATETIGEVLKIASPF